MDHVDQIKAQWREQRPDLDVEPMGIIGRMARLTRHLQAEHDRIFERHGLNNAGFDVLATLRRAGPPHALTPKQMLASAMISSGTMTNRLDRLEEAGLIRRSPDPADGRGVLIQLTEAGLAKVDATVTDHVQNQQAMIAALPPAQRQQLDAALTAWLAAFESPEQR